MSKIPGIIVIISSPSGGGKTSICRKLLSTSRKKQGWQFSISYTTRKKRPGERNGREYFFVDETSFQEMADKNLFAEHFKVHLSRYGTPRKPLEKVKINGGVMILDVDVQGAMRLSQEYPEAITIFILPPSIKELKRRLKGRGTETKEQLRVRFENSKKEIKDYRKFSYVVINHDVNEATAEVLSIIKSNSCRTENIDKEQIRKLLV